MMKVAVVAAAALAGSAVVRADTTTCDFATNCNTAAFNTFLDRVGLDTSSTQITDNTLMIPESASGTADLTFNFVGDNGGGYQYDFGYCLSSDAGVMDALAGDLTTDAGKFDFAKACIGADRQLFADAMTADGGAADTVTASVDGLAAPSDLYFYIMPNDPIDTFNADPEAFWAQSAADVDSTGNPRPLFSIADANPGQFDQFVAFTNDVDTTVFIWEDITRDPAVPTQFPGDSSFDDLAFSVNIALVGVEEPEPTCDCYVIDCGCSAGSANTPTKCVELQFADPADADNLNCDPRSC